MNNSTAIAIKEYECIDCGNTIKKGERYARSHSKDNKVYIYCMKCKKERHTRTGDEPLRLLNLLETGPMFQDEILKHMSRGVLNRYFLHLKQAGIKIYRFRYKIRSHNSRKIGKKIHGIMREPVNFIIHYLDGQEKLVIQKIEEKYGNYFTRRHWRDMLVPIIGEDKIKIGIFGIKEYV